MTSRFQRQSFLGDLSEQTISSSKVGVIGLCGGGSHVAQQLAHIGFRRLLLADFDQVEDHNLTRMVGSEPSDADEARLKTEVIRRMVLRILSDADVDVANNPWQGEEQKFRDCDVIFGCVDKLSVREDIERFCRRYLIPYIDVGMDVHEVDGGFAISGQVITSLPHGPCMRCLGFLTDERLAMEQGRYGAAGGRPQVIWPNGILASAAVNQLMTLLTPWNDRLRCSPYIEYDGNSPSLQVSARLKYLEVGGCPHFDGEGAVGDPFFKMPHL